MTGLRYVHKPVVVQAMQVPKHADLSGLELFMKWLLGNTWTMDQGGSFAFPDPGGDTDTVVLPGEWVIKDATGGLHFCDDATFAASYEPTG